MKPIISVIIPHHHETASEIHNSISQIREYLKNKGYPLEIIVAENGTFKPLKDSKNFKIIRTKKSGLGLAYKKGIAAASGQYIYTLSSDIPFQFSDLDHFLKHKKENSIIFGSKLHPQSTYRINWIRKLGTILQHIAAQILFPRFTIRDPNGSFFGHTKILKKILPSIKADNYFFTTELALTAHLNSIHLIEVPVKYIKKDKNSSVNIYLYGYSFLIQILKFYINHQQFLKKNLGLLVIPIFLIIYLSPLFFKNINVAGLTGDNLAHAAYTEQYCDNNLRGINFDSKLFALTGTSIATNYDFPALSLFGCLFRPLGPIAMLNAIVCLQVILIFGTGMLVAKKYLKANSSQIAFIFFYGFSAFSLTRMQYHINLLSTVWGTALAFYMFADLNLSSLKKTVAAFAVLALIFSSSWQNIPNLFLPVSILIIYRLFSNKLNQTRIVNLILGSIICLLITSVSAWSMIMNYSAGYTAKTTNEIFVFNADLFSFFIPFEKHLLRPVFNNMVELIEQRRGTYLEKVTSFDPLLIILSVYLLLNHLSTIQRISKQTRLFVTIGLISVLLSFGPEINLLGKNILSLDYYQILSKFPPYSITRTPARLAIVAIFIGTLGFCILVDTLDRKNNSSKLFRLSSVTAFLAVIGTTLLSNNLLYPHTQIDSFIPVKILTQISQDPTDARVLNLPLALLDDPSQNFLQIYHHKPLITGYISYTSLSDPMIAAINQGPVLKALDCHPKTDEYVSYLNSLFQTPDLFMAEMKAKNVGYIIVNLSYINTHPNCEGMKAIELWLSTQTQYLSLYGQNSHYAVYRLKPTPGVGL